MPANAGLLPVFTTSTTTTAAPIPSIKELDCDFESACKWSTVRTGDFNFTVVDSATGFNNYGGPNADHSGGVGGGNYLVANTLNLRANFSLGKYESPIMNQTKCVEFWYYMYGTNVGTLSLSRRTNTSTFTTKVYNHILQFFHFYF